jgi:hypothetical protein
MLLTTKTENIKKIIFSFLIMLSGVVSLVAQEDKEGSKDPALFTRMPVLNFM